MHVIRRGNIKGEAAMSQSKPKARASATRRAQVRGSVKPRPSSLRRKETAVLSMERGRKRFHLSLPLTVRPKNGEMEQTVTENISTTGCYFRSSHALPLGSEVQMEVAMPVFRSVRRTFKITCR